MLGLQRHEVVLVFDFVELGHPFERNVVGLGGPGGEEDFLRGGPEERRDLGAGFFDGLLGLPAVAVGTAVGVAVGLGEVGEHGVKDPGVEGGGGLHVEVEVARGGGVGGAEGEGGGEGGGEGAEEGAGEGHGGEKKGRSKKCVFTNKCFQMNFFKQLLFKKSSVWFCEIKKVLGVEVRFWDERHENVPQTRKTIIKIIIFPLWYILLRKIREEVKFFWEKRSVIYPLFYWNCS